jgi:hypothetical protein
MKWLSRKNKDGVQWFEAYIHPNPSALKTDLDKFRCFIYVAVVPTPAGKWYWHARGWGGAVRGDVNSAEEGKEQATQKLRKMLEEAYEAGVPMEWNRASETKSGVFSQTGTALDGFLQVHITSVDTRFFLDMRGWADGMSLTVPTKAEAKKAAQDEFKTLVKQLREQV